MVDLYMYIHVPVHVHVMYRCTSYRQDNKISIQYLETYMYKKRTKITGAWDMYMSLACKI